MISTDEFEKAVAGKFSQICEDGFKSFEPVYDKVCESFGTNLIGLGADPTTYQFVVNDNNISYYAEIFITEVAHNLLNIFRKFHENQQDEIVCETDLEIFLLGMILGNTADKEGQVGAGLPRLMRSNDVLNTGLEYINREQVQSLIKHKAQGTLTKENILEIWNETFQIMFDGLLSRCSARGDLECAFDDEKNKFVHWVDPK
jgi:hypothetical protein